MTLKVLGWFRKPEQQPEVTQAVQDSHQSAQEAQSLLESIYRAAVAKNQKPRQR